MVDIVLQERRKRKASSIFEEISPPISSNHSHPHQKKVRVSPNMEKARPFPIGWWFWATCSFFKSFYSISINSQPLKFNQLTVNLQKIFIFSVSNNGIQWTLYFDPDSVTIAVNDLGQNKTISSQEKPLAVWQLLLSQMQDFLDNHLARVPITQKGGTMEMRDEVLSSVEAQDLDTSSY